MLRGRHRGLPVALDRAVRLPEEVGLGGREEVSVLVPVRRLGWLLIGIGGPANETQQEFAAT